MPRDWIVKPHHERIEEYSLHFTYLPQPSSAFAFPCDRDGNLISDQYFTKEQRESVAAELRANPKYAAPYVMDLSRDWFNPGSLRCHCGREHHLARGDSDCECGQIYNACGQELVPREQWEERYDDDY